MPAERPVGADRLTRHTGTSNVEVSWLDLEAEGVEITINGPKYRPTLKVAAE